MIASPSGRRLTGLAIGVAVAVAAAVLSVGRLLLTSSTALSDLVWAEDGLFPLCARAHGAISCAVEPYAGYLLVLPRAVAWPVGLIPMDSWPAATNIAAAILAAATAGAVVYVVRASGSGWTCSILLALMPVAAPIMGFEAINSTANSYLLLPYVACLAICLPARGRFPTVAYAIGVLVTALTIPSALVLLLPLAVHAWRKRIPRRDAAVVGAALIVGLALQALAILTAGTSRSPGFSWSATRSFADVLPSVWLTNWPFYQWRMEAGSFVPVPWADYGIGLLVIAVAVVAGVALMLRPGYVASAVGLLVVCGLGFAMIPAVLLASTNNRYYVLLLLLWTAAGVVALDRFLRDSAHRLVMVGAAALLALLWIPSLPAQPYRATANPPWSTALLKARFACLDNRNGFEALEFSPRWPSASIDLRGLTTNVVPCSAIEGPLAG